MSNFPFVSLEKYDVIWKGRLGVYHKSDGTLIQVTLQFWKCLGKENLSIHAKHCDML